MKAFQFNTASLLLLVSVLSVVFLGVHFSQRKKEALRRLEAKFLVAVQDDNRISIGANSLSRPIVSSDVELISVVASRVAELNLSNNGKINCSSEFLENLDQLEILVLDNSSFNDDFTKHLPANTTLRSLYLRNTGISLGSAKLTGVSRVEKLYLSGNLLSEEFLRSIGNLKNLTRLEILNCNVSESAVIGLKRKIPNCLIQYSDPESGKEKVL